MCFVTFNSTNKEPITFYSWTFIIPSFAVMKIIKNIYIYNKRLCSVIFHSGRDCISSKVLHLTFVFWFSYIIGLYPSNNSIFFSLFIILPKCHVRVVIKD